MHRLVALAMPAGADFVRHLAELWDAGDAVLPLDPRMAPPALKTLVDTLRPACVIDSSGSETTLMEAIPVDDGDALVVATSGSTGVPKGVVLSHAAVEAAAHATSARLSVDPARDHWLACLPLSHVGGLSVVTRALATGTPLTVIERFDAETVEACADVGATLVSVVPTTLARMHAEKFRVVVVGGSAPPAVRPPNAVCTYGMTESGGGVVYDGVPLDGVDIDLRSDSDASGGEIRLRGPMLAGHYRNDEPVSGPGGWYATGDAGHFADGRLVVDGRLSELIVTGGENVWPAPIEDVLRTHPAVADAAVAGRADDEWGEIVVAFVVPAEPSAPPSLEELRAHVKENIAPYAAPRELVVTSRLPRTALGKLVRSALAHPA